MRVFGSIHFTLIWTIIPIYNIQTMIKEIIARNKKPLILVVLITAAIFLSWNFLSHSPSGCYGKALLIGSSVCHQIPSHSFSTDAIQFPVCARCTGLYLGSFIGILYGFLSGKKIAIPKKKYLVFLAILFIFWAGDGLNSLVNDFLIDPLIYQTTNTTRLITGYGMGLVMSTALVTLFNFTVWKTGIKIPVLDNVQQIVGYAILSALSSQLILTNNRFLFQVAAYIATFMILSIITLLYSIFWVILFKKENRFSRWKEFAIYILAGYATAILQVILLIALRTKFLF